MNTLVFDPKTADPTSHRGILLRTPPFTSRIRSDSPLVVEGLLRCYAAFEIAPDDTFADFDLQVSLERHLLRRPVAPPPLQRPVTLGELIRQLEEIAERLEQEEGKVRQRQRSKRFSDRAVIEQVAALAHREKLPETTAALSQFLLHWPQALEWSSFEELVAAWAAAVEAKGAAADLDADRVGVFWALLFLCHQGKVELEQAGGLFGPLSLKRLLDVGESVQLPLVPASLPAREVLAA